MTTKTYSKQSVAQSQATRKNQTAEGGTWVVTPEGDAWALSWVAAKPIGWDQIEGGGEVAKRTPKAAEYGKKQLAQMVQQSYYAAGAVGNDRVAQMSLDQLELVIGKSKTFSGAIWATERYLDVG